MKWNLLLAASMALAVSACTSIRVSGFVTDADSGEPIGSCGVTFGEFYQSCDRAGHYVIKGRKTWRQMQVIAPGYETTVVPVDASKTRLPLVNVQMTPKKSSRASRAPEPPEAAPRAPK